MCGLAGVVSFDDRRPVTREALEAMNARLAHRGPDGEGIWLSHNGQGGPAGPAGRDRPQAGLAHRRLAIIDPDPRADQPFTDGGGRWLVFNGEIYNYRELRQQLEPLLPGNTWRTRSDTEVLLAAYAAWGPACVDRLNGMYAFAVWDARGELFLARDRMGQKPLYIAYLQRGGGWAQSLDGPLDPPAVIGFASELGALRAMPGFEAALDTPALVEYLRWGYCIAPRTIFRGALALGPNCWLKVDREGARAGRHRFSPLSPRAPLASIPDDEARRETRRLVQQAVRRQMVADVPIGCFLSGGVDSSIIAASMRLAAGPQRVMTFSIGFDDPRYDETRFARRVAAHLGTEHHEFIVRPDAAADLPKLAKVFGEPFADSSALPTHYLARETRRDVKVALSGDGGDELFCGYDRYRAMRLGQRIRSLTGGPPARWLAALGRRLPGQHPKGRLARLRRFLESLDQPADRRYGSYLRIFDDRAIADLLPGAAACEWSDPADRLAGELFDPAGGEDPVRAAMALDRMLYLPGDLLTKVDRASMLHALEVRSPFMDDELVEFTAGLSTRQLLAGGPKRMLREAFSDSLPAWVFGRRKMGFAVPIGQWFRDSLGAMLRDHLLATTSFARSHFSMAAVERLIEEHQRERADHSQRLYALLMLELWWRE